MAFVSVTAKSTVWSGPRLSEPSFTRPPSRRRVPGRWLLGDVGGRAEEHDRAAHGVQDQHGERQHAAAGGIRIRRRFLRVTILPPAVRRAETRPTGTVLILVFEGVGSRRPGQGRHQDRLSYGPRPTQGPHDFAVSRIGLVRDSLGGEVQLPGKFRRAAPPRRCWRPAPSGRGRGPSRAGSRSPSAL